MTTPGDDQRITLVMHNVEIVRQIEPDAECFFLGGALFIDITGWLEHDPRNAMLSNANRFSGIFHLVKGFAETAAKFTICYRFQHNIYPQNNCIIIYNYAK